MLNGYPYYRKSTIISKIIILNQYKFPCIAPARFIQNVVLNPKMAMKQWNCLKYILQLLLWDFSEYTAFGTYVYVNYQHFLYLLIS